MSQHKKRPIPAWTFHVFQAGYHLAANAAAAAGKPWESNPGNKKRNKPLQSLVSILEEDGLLPAEGAPMFASLQALAA